MKKWIVIEGESKSKTYIFWICISNSLYKYTKSIVSRKRLSLNIIREITNGNRVVGFGIASTINNFYSEPELYLCDQKIIKKYEVDNS